MLTDVSGLQQTACFMGGGEREEKEEREDSQTFQGVIHDGCSFSEKWVLITGLTLCEHLVSWSYEHHGILKFLLSLILHGLIGVQLVRIF